MKKVLYLLLLICSVSLAQNESFFEKANTLYNNEKYEEAIQYYQQILNSGEHSVSLYYNKANAHYKLNQIAESIYNYEKALQLDPGNEDVLNNLAFANNMKIDKIDVIPTTGLSKLFASFVNMFGFETWAVITIGLMLVFVVSFVLYMLAQRAAKKRLYFVASGIGLLFSLITLLFAYQQEENTKNTVYAIVFAKESQAKAEPKSNSEEAFTLHEGTKVRAFEDFDGWTKVKLTNGSIGWMQSKDIKKL